MSGLRTHPMRSLVFTRAPPTPVCIQRRLRNPCCPVPYWPVQVSAQHRKLFNDILSSTLGEPPLRHLTHSRTLPYPPALLFKAISRIEDYPQFLPFLLSSAVTARDARGYPTRAQLRVGYEKLGLEEIWDSIVRCDEKKGIVEAKGVEESAREQNDTRHDDHGLFQVLRTRWEIEPVSHLSSATPFTGKSSIAKLDVHVKFRNPLYDQMFAQVEDRVARAMTAAFEKRVMELNRP